MTGHGGWRAVERALAAMIVVLLAFGGAAVAAADGFGPAADGLQPADGAQLNEQLPAVTVTFDRDVTVGPDGPTVTIVASDPANNPEGVSGAVENDGDGKPRRLVISYTGVLADDTYTVTLDEDSVREVADDTSGNRVIEWSFTVDTQPPAAPVITDITDPVNDGNAGEVEVSGTAEQGSSVTVTVRDHGGAESVSAPAPPAADGTWTVSLDGGELADGPLTAVAVARDQAANDSAPSAPATARKDTAAPAPAAVAPSDAADSRDSSPLVAAQFDEAVSAAGETGIDQGKVSFTGPDGAVAGAQAELLPSGTLRVGYPEPLPDGEYTVTVQPGTLVDGAGNLNEAFDWSFTIESAAVHGPPVITSFPDVTADNVNAVSVVGVAQAGASVTLTVTDATGDQQVFPAEGAPAVIAGENGAWSFQNLDLSAAAEGVLTATASTPEIIDGDDTADGDGWTSAPAVARKDTVRPAVEQTIPEPGGTVAGPLPRIAATFDEPLQPADSPGAVVVAGTSLYAGDPADGAPVEHAAVLDVDTVHLVPRGDLDPGRYTAVISAESVTDYVGNIPGVDLVWSFTVVRATGPTARAFTPQAATAEQSPTVSLSFDRPVALAEGAAPLTITGASTGDVEVAGAAVGEDGRTVTIEYTAPLADDSYTVTVPPGFVADDEGQGNAETSWVFGVAAAAPTVTIAPQARPASAQMVVTGAVEAGAAVTVSVTAGGDTPATISRQIDSERTAFGSYRAEFGGPDWDGLPDGALAVAAVAVVPDRPQGEADGEAVKDTAAPQPEGGDGQPAFSPGDGQTAGSPTPEIAVRFSEAVLPGDGAFRLCADACEGGNEIASGALFDDPDGRRVRLAYPGPLPDGTYQVQADAGAVADGAGNANQAFAWTFSVSAGIAAQPTPANGSVTGQSSPAVALTFDRPVAAVSGDDGDTGGVTLTGTQGGAVQVTGRLESVDGEPAPRRLLLDYEGALADDVYVARVEAGTVRQQDVHDNNNNETTWVFRVDTTAPALAVVPQTGPVRDRLRVSGTTEPGAAVTVSVTDGAEGELNRQLDGSESAAGAFSVEFTDELAQLADGELTITVTAIDAAGNTARPHIETVWKDTVEPDAVATSPGADGHQTGAPEVWAQFDESLRPGAHFGEVSLVRYADEQDEDGTPHPAGALLEDQDGHGASSRLRITYAGRLLNGRYTVTVPAGAVTDAAGNAAGEVAWAFTVREGALPVAVGFEPVAVTGSRQPVVAVTFDRPVALTGATGVTASLVAADSDNSPETVTAAIDDANPARLVFSYDGSLADDLYTATVEEGLVADASDSDKTNRETAWSFRVDTTAPAVALVPQTRPVNAEVTVSGVAEAGALTVIVRDTAGAEVSDSRDHAGGPFQVSLDVGGLNEGAAAISAEVADEAGNIGRHSDEVRIDRTPPAEAAGGRTPAPGSRAGQTTPQISVRFDSEPHDQLLPGPRIGELRLARDGEQQPAGGVVDPAAGLLRVTYAGPLPNGRYTVTVPAGAVADLAGNTNPSEITWSFDVAGIGVSIDEPGPINAGNAGAYTVAGDAPAGATVRVTADDENPATAPVDDTTTATEAGRFAVTLDVSSLDDGTVHLAATATSSGVDGAGGGADAATATKDTAALTITLTVPDYVNGASQAAVAISGVVSSATGAAAGSAVTVSVSDGTDTVDHELVAGSDGGFARSFDLSGLADGTLTITADAVSPSGNAGTATATSTKDVVAPAAPADLAFPALVTKANESAFTVTGTAEPGASVAVTVRMAPPVAPITQTAAAAGDGAFSASLDVSAMPDGELFVSAAATDPAGNAGPASEADAPAIKSSHSLAFTTAGAVGAQKVTFQASEPLRPDTVDTNSAGGFSDFTESSARSITSVLLSEDDTLLSVFFDGPLASGESVTLVAGAVATPAGNTNTQVVHGIAPPPPSITFVTDPIHQSNAAAVQVSGTTEAGTTVSVTMTGPAGESQTGNATVTGTSFSATFNLTAYADGVITATATAAKSTFVSQASAPRTANKGTTLAAPAIDEYPDTITSANRGNVRVAGRAAPGAQVTVELSRTTADKRQAVVTASGAGDWSCTFDLSSGGPADGTLQLSAVASKDGNTSAATVVSGIVKDTVSVIAIGSATDPVTSANRTAFATAGGAEAGSSVTVSVDDSDPSTEPVQSVVFGGDPGGAWSISGMDVSPLRDGTLTVTAVATDPHGNVGTATRTVTKLSVGLVAAPAINLANHDDFEVAGTTHPERDVTITLSDNDNELSRTVRSDAAGAFSGRFDTTGGPGGLGIPEPALTDGPVKIVAVVTFAAGATDRDELTVTRDTVRPAAPGALTAPAFVGPDTQPEVPVSGSAEPSGTVRLEVLGLDGTDHDRGVTAPVGEDGAWASTLDFTDLPDGGYEVIARATDRYGNDGDETADVTTTLDTTAPGAPTITVFVVGDADQHAVTIQGAAEQHATVELTVTDHLGRQVTPEPVVATASGFRFDGVDLSTLEDGELAVTATAIDRAGNRSEQAALTVTKRTQAPVAPVIDTWPAWVNNAGKSSVTVAGAAESGTQARLSVSSSGGGTAVAAGPQTVAGGRFSFTVNATALADGTLTYTVTTTDDAGNQTTSVPVTGGKDVLAPVKPATPTAPAVVNAANQHAVPVTGGPGAAEPDATVRVVGANGAAQTEPVEATAGADGAYGLTVGVSGLPDGNIEFRATATDAAGNTSPASDPVVSAKDTEQLLFTTFGASGGTQVEFHANRALAPGTVDTDSRGGFADFSHTAGATLIAVAVNDAADVIRLTFDGPLAAGESVTLHAGAVSSTAGNANAADVTHTVAGVQVAITSAPDPIHQGNHTAVVVAGTTEPGASVTVTIDDGEPVVPASPVSGTATAAANGTFTVTGLDVSQLPDGELVVVAVASKHGSTSEADTVRVRKDTRAPVTLNAPAHVNAATESAVPLEGVAEPGATVAIVIEDSRGEHGRVTVIDVADADTGKWEASVNVTDLLDGELTIAAKVTDDGHGNQSLQADEESSVTVKDTIAPVRPVITSVTAPVNTTRADPDGTVPADVTGVSEPDASVVVTVASGTATATATATVAPTGTFTATVDVADLPDGQLAVTAVATDPAGNPGEASPPSPTVKDMVKPHGTQTSPAAMVAVAAPEVSVTLNEPVVAQAGFAQAALSRQGGDPENLVVRAVIEPGPTPQTPKVRFVYRGVTTEGDPPEPSSEERLPDGLYTATIPAGALSDPFGNPSDALTWSFRIDTRGLTLTLADDLPVAAAANAAAYEVSGAVNKPHATVTLVAADGGGNATEPVEAAVAADGSFSATLDLTGLLDGTVTITATAGDGIRTETAVVQMDKDTQAPSLAAVEAPDWVSTANQAAVPVSGEISGAGVVHAALDDEDDTTEPVEGAFATSDAFEFSLDAGALTDGPLTLELHVRDIHGNRSAVTTVNLDKDTVVPGAPTLTSVTDPIDRASGGVLAVAGTVADSDAAAVILTVTGPGAEPSSASLPVSAGAFDGSIDVSGFHDGTLTVAAAVRDVAGNTGASASRTTAKKTILPAAPTAVSATPGSQQATVTWSAPPANGGTAVTGYLVTAHLAEAPTGAAVASANAPGDRLNATVTGLSNGTSYVFRVAASNTAGTGEASAPSAPVTPAATGGGGGFGGGDGGTTSPSPSPSPVPSPSVSPTPAPPDREPEAGPLPPAGSSRVSGQDRASTAAALSASLFEPGIQTVFLVTSGNFADALAGGPAAAQAGSPVLLADRDRLPASTREEIQRLAPSRVVVLGGTNAVSEAVAAEVAAVGPQVERIAGSDRFTTAAAVSAASFPERTAVVFIATGGGFADALSGGAAAARDAGPVLLVSPGGVPEATAAELRRLAPRQIVVLGGSAAVPPQVAAELDAFTDGPVERVSGPDRYATSAAVAARAFPVAVDTVYVATGENFPDALAGVPAAAQERAPLLLVRRDGVPDSVAAQLERLRPRRIVILGGDGAVSAETERALGRYAVE